MALGKCQITTTLRNPKWCLTLDLIRWWNSILSRQLQQSAIVVRKQKKVLIIDQMMKWGGRAERGIREEESAECPVLCSSPNWNPFIDSSRSLELVEITSTCAWPNGSDTWDTHKKYSNTYNIGLTRSQMVRVSTSLFHHFPLCQRNSK